MTRRGWILLAAIVMAVSAYVFASFWISNDNPFRLRFKSRRVWKDEAIKDITARVGDSNWVQSEVQQLRVNASNEWWDARTWLSSGLIMMTNGDWIAYTNVCRKEMSGIYDLFIGHGSDHKWYYSTYHFCIKMSVLRSNVRPAPGNFLEFASEYYLREFDGHSGDCLRKTWPPKGALSARTHPDP